MRLILKIIYLFPWYFFKVKKTVKKGITGMGVLSFARDLGVSFFVVPNLQN